LKWGTPPTQVAFTWTSDSSRSNLTWTSSPELSLTSTCQPSLGDVPLRRAVRPVQDTVTEPAAPDHVRVSVRSVDEVEVLGAEGVWDLVGDDVGDAPVVCCGLVEAVAPAEGLCFGVRGLVGALPTVPMTTGWVSAAVGLPVTWLPARSIATQVSADPAITTTTHAVTARNHIRLLT